MAADQKNENFSEHIAALLAELPKRQRDVLQKRFGLKDGRRRTLEEIGGEYQITRERVRQIENDAKNAIAESDSFERLAALFELMREHFERHGGVRPEYKLFEEDAQSVFFASLKAEIARSYLHFLLSLHELFVRHSETDAFHAVWALAHADPSAVREALTEVARRLETHGKPVSREELLAWLAAHAGEEREHILISHLAGSKQVLQNVFGEYGLAHWPEIATRGVRDKAYLVLKKQAEPMHFLDIVKRINKMFGEEKQAHPQTVHNELIKNEKFVLVGRGMYALSEWGYKPGKVADVLMRVFKEEGRPMSRDEVVDAVLRERNVKPNTILLNLQNRAHFERMEDGKFVLRTHFGTPSNPRS